MAIAREELTGSPTVPELMEQDIIRKQAYGSLIGVYTQLTQKFGGSQRQRREAA